MNVREVVQLEDGRNVIVNLTEQEHQYLLSFAINNLIAMGMMQGREEPVVEEEAPFIEVDGAN
jgi:hypothetical protein